jgi:hypothetical protein
LHEFSLEALGYGVVVGSCLDMLIQAAVGSLGGWDLPLGILVLLAKQGGEEVNAKAAAIHLANT